MTPREHLAFAARVHRQTISSASASATNAFHAFASAEDRDATEGLLREAGLGEGHAPNTPVESLDPGARRALQVALAFVGAALPVREEDHGDGDGSDPRWRSRVVLTSNAGELDSGIDARWLALLARGADDGGVGDAKRRRWSGGRRCGDESSRRRKSLRRTLGPRILVA